MYKDIVEQYKKRKEEEYRQLEQTLKECLAREKAQLDAQYYTWCEEKIADFKSRTEKYIEEAYNSYEKQLAQLEERKGGSRSGSLSKKLWERSEERIKEQLDMQLKFLNNQLEQFVAEFQTKRH